mmetsp:Transcript_47412/g.122501  ORF Transcript_47412/g.122501 Transcript_47412/m.122501 type:complete len:486 (-) Transcript_47412:204-1661(-)
MAMATRWWLPLLLFAAAQGESLQSPEGICIAELCSEGRAGLEEESALLQMPAEKKEASRITATTAAKAGSAWAGTHHHVVAHKKVVGEAASPNGSFAASNVTMMKTMAEAPVKAAGQNTSAVASVREVHHSGMGMIVAFGGASLATAGVILFLFWGRGFTAITQVFAYVLCLSAIKFTVKLVQDVNGFRFPIFLTMTHFAFGAFGALAIGHVWQESMRWPTKKEWTTRFLPISAAQATSVAMNNTALLYANASFCEIVADTTPLVTVAIILLFGQPFNMRLLAPLAVILFGTLVSSAGEVSFSVLGLSLAVGSNIFRGVRVTIQHMVLVKAPVGAEERAFTPVEVLVYTCIPSAIIMFFWSLCQEGLKPARALSSPGAPLVFALLLSIANASCLNLAVLTVIKEFGAVGSQLIAQAKTILVVLGSMALFGEKVTVMEGVGFVLVMTGVRYYNWLEALIKREEEPKMLEAKLHVDKLRNCDKQEAA